MQATKETISVMEVMYKYHSALETIAKTPNEIKIQQSKLSKIRSSYITDMPRAAANPKIGEEILCNGIDFINFMEKRYNEAELFLEWFKPMWDILSEDERELIETLTNNRKTSAVEKYSEEKNISISQAYRNRNKACKRLHFLLFGYG